MFFYQSDVKEASGMLNIHFGLALIDTLDLIEEAFSKKQEYYFSFVIIEYLAFESSRVRFSLLTDFSLKDMMEIEQFMGKKLRFR